MSFSPNSLKLHQLGRTSTIKRYSDADEKDPMAKAAIFKTFSHGLDPAQRLNRVTTTAFNHEYALIWHQKVAILNNPMPATTIGNDVVYIGSCSDVIGECIPVSIDPDVFGGQFTTLVTKKMAEDYLLPQALEHPDTVSGPLIAGEGGIREASCAPEMHRLGFPDTEISEANHPRVVVLPIVCPLYKGCPSLPENHDLHTPFPDEIIAEYPLLEIWREGHSYLVRQNNSFSVTEEGGPLFDTTAFSRIALDRYAILASPHAATPTMIDPTSEHFAHVTSVTKAAEASALSTLGLAVQEAGTGQNPPGANPPRL